MGVSVLKDYIETAENLTKYLREKGQGHNHYKMYSTMNRILEIRQEGNLYLSRGDNWNDISDRENFNHSNQDITKFGRCFSFSAEESVAMWMLYGGNDKHGGMIDFTRKGIQSILRTSDVEVGYFENNSFIPLYNLKRDQFSIFVTDILYYRKKGTSYYIKRGDETVKQLPACVFDSLDGCTKVYPWEYENECRLIVSISKEYIDDRCNQIRINLDNLNLGKSYERVYRSPNYKGNPPENTSKSMLQGSIDWDYCKNCKHT